MSSAGPVEEVLLDLAEATKTQYPSIQNQLVDFGVVGPGPRRALNFVNNRCPPLNCATLCSHSGRLLAAEEPRKWRSPRRYWFDNEQDRSPQAEAMYLEELREFKAFLVENTVVDELSNLNLLGVQ